jgi:hypothetical protein
VLGPGQAQVLSQHLEQRPVHGEEELGILAVDTQMENLALRVPLELVQHREL